MVQNSLLNSTGYMDDMDLPPMDEDESLDDSYDA